MMEGYTIPTKQIHESTTHTSKLSIYNALIFSPPESTLMSDFFLEYSLAKIGPKGQSKASSKNGTSD